MEQPAQLNSEANIALPEESVAPDVGKKPAHIDTPDNLAGDEALAKEVQRVLQSTWSRLDSQEARQHWTDRIVNNDRMYRCSEKRVAGKAERQTVSNVSDTGFRRRIDTVHANEMSVLIPDDGLPAFYEMSEDPADFDGSDEEQSRIIDDRNALAMHYWEEDDRVAKLRMANWLTNKEENCVVSMEWERKVHTERVRSVSERDEDGKPTKFSFKDRVVTDKDCPSLVIHDAKDVWFDTTVRDEQQSPWIKRRDVLMHELYAEQEAGSMMNVGKITASQLSHGHDTSDADLENERNDNAGQASNDEEPNGLIRLYEFWERLPIDENGKWAPGKVLPTIHWCTFAGRIDGPKIPLRIIKNPYNHGLMPFKVLHSHRDNRGMLNDGFGTFLEGLWDEANTNINQAIDNKTARNRAVWVVSGHVGTRDLTLRGGLNKTIKVGANGKIDQLMPQDTTQITMQMSDRIEDMMDRAAGTDKPLSGESLGARTSATEAKNVFDQAVKAPLAKARYWAEDQLLPWVFRMEASMSDQASDPKRIISVLGRTIRPATLHGGFNVRVTVITEHANNSLARQQMAAWVQNDYPVLKEDMTPEGKQIVGEKAARMAGFSSIEASQMFGKSDIVDSVNRAREEAGRILFEGEFVQPEPGINLGVHIEVKEGVLSRYQDAIKAGEDADPQRAAQLEAHINDLRRMQSEQSQQLQATAANIPAQQQPPQDALQGQPSTFVGENIGGQIAAQEGAVA